MKKMTREDVSNYHNRKQKAAKMKDEYRKRQISEASKRYRRMLGLPVEEENKNDREASDSDLVHSGGKDAGTVRDSASND